MDVFGIFDVPLWVTLALLTVTLLYIYGVHSMKTWSNRGVPGPAPIPLIGNFHQFISASDGMRGCISKWQQDYGRIIGMHYFRKPCVIITDVDVLKDVFVKEFNVYYDRFFIGGGSFFPDTLTKGVFFQRGSHWKRIRRIISATFSSGKIKSLTHHMNTTARQLADKFEDHAKKGTQPSAKDIFGAYSLDVIAGTILSLEINSQIDTSPRFVKMVRRLFSPTFIAKLTMPFAGMFPPLGYVFLKLGISVFNTDAVDYLTESIGKLVSERKSNNNDNSKLHDTVQYLIDAEMDESDTSSVVGEKKLTKEEVISQVISFLLAGYDTTSSALLFIVFNLIKHKDAQEKLLQEIHSVVGDADGVTYEHCQQLTYMECVINETLRLFPPIIWLKRETSKATTMKGYTIPVNTGVIVPVYTIGRDPEIFEDPDNFNPDRFRSDVSAGAVYFLPFGFGPKSCVGLRLAVMEIKIAIVHIFKRVKFEDMTHKTLTLTDYGGVLALKEPLRLLVKPLHQQNGNASTANAL